ncbi:MAG: hypothetical protein ABIY55_13935 [Kofleriaceae bacterium]
MRKTTMWISMLSAALLSTAACHKKDDAGKAMDKAATSAQKAQEDVNDQAKDVAKEQKDVNKDQQTMAKDQADVAKQQGEMNAAQLDLTQARERYNVAASQRLTNLDGKLRQIELKTDATAKDTAAKLRVRRDEIASRLGAAGNTAQADWDKFKKDVDDSFDKLEKDVDSALK